MSATALTRVISAIAGAPPVSEWNSHLLTVERERVLIDQALDSGALGWVYGFSSLLGHMDHESVSADSQQRVLDQHLVGPVQTMPVTLWHSALACKIEQHSSGGSGVRPEVLRALIGHCAERHSPRGNWVYSYGAGDVVQGAWLVSYLCKQSPTLMTERGDLISLINGSFFSTGAAIHAVLGALPALARFEQAYARSIECKTRTQLPVSLRDAAPVIEEVHDALRQFGQAAEDRLSRPSANPLFVVTDGEVSAHSQSSFLGFAVTAALRRMQSATLLVISLWQRLILHTSDRITEALPPAEVPVQPPKIAQAVVERAYLRAAGAPRFGGDDSHGVEDLRDGSLLQVEVLAALLGECRAQESIWEALVGSHGDDSPDGDSRAFIEKAMRSLLGGDSHEHCLRAVRAAQSESVAGDQ